MSAAVSYLAEKKRGVVLSIELNRPPSNMFSIAFMRSLKNRVNECAKDPSVRCLVFSSGIPKYFSAGIDLDEFFTLPEDKRHEIFVELLELFKALTLFPKPAIAAVSGYAMLGGWILAMACDFRFMAQETGKLALSEIKLGISPTSLLARVILNIASNKNLAKELILTGRTFRAEEALEAGFVNQIFPTASLLEETFRQAEKLAEMPSQAYASVKRSYKEWELGDLDAAVQKSKKEFMELFRGPESKEGFNAVREKRRPKFHPTTSF